MPKSTKTTVAIYARVSTDDKGQDSTSQLEQLRTWCRSQGYRIFREMFDAAPRHEFDLVPV